MWCSYMIRVVPFYCDYFSGQSLDLSILHLFRLGFFFKTASRENSKEQSNHCKNQLVRITQKEEL